MNPERCRRAIRISFNSRQLLSGLAFGGLLVNLGFLIGYLFVEYRNDIHSDSAMKVLLAREIVSTKDYFPDDWNYVNSDLFVLFGHTFVLPVLGFLPAGFVAHAISGLISAILILSGVWFLSGISHIGLTRRFAVVAVMAAGISGFLAENLYGQASYGPTLYFSLFILFSTWKAITTTSQGYGAWVALLGVLVCLAFWANPQRALVYQGIPLLGALLLSELNRSEPRSLTTRKRLSVTVSVIGVAILLGGGLHVVTVAGVNVVPGASEARWLSFDQMLINMQFVMKGYLAVLGGLPTAGSEVVSLTGVLEATRLALALALSVLIPIAVVRAIRQGALFLSFLGWYAALGFALSLFFYVFTTLPDMSDPVQSSRYLVPTMVLLLLAFLMQPLSPKRNPTQSLFVLWVFVVLGGSAIPALYWSDLSSGRMTLGHHEVRNDLLGLLTGKGLAYGYGTYWNAGALSVLSNESVLVRQIHFHNGIPVPMRHLSSNRWYRPSAWEGQTFLLVDSDELQHLDQSRMAQHGLQPTEVLEFRGYTVFIYPRNIAEHLPGWDPTYEKDTRFYVTASSLSQTGRFVENFSEEGHALVADIGDVGALHYGPYVDAEPGVYAARFDLHVDAKHVGGVRLDVAGASDQQVLAEKVVTESQGEVELVFENDRLQPLEFRVWALGSAEVVFKGVTLHRLAPRSDTSD